MVDIKKFEDLKNRLEVTRNKVLSAEVQKKNILKEVTAILKKYGISDIKEYKKLAEIKDKKEEEVKLLETEIEKYLQETQSKLNEIENIISLD